MGACLGYLPPAESEAIYQYSNQGLTLPLVW